MFVGLLSAAHVLVKLSINETIGERQMVQAEGGITTIEASDIVPQELYVGLSKQ